MSQISSSLLYLNYPCYSSFTRSASAAHSSGVNQFPRLYVFLPDGDDLGYLAHFLVSNATLRLYQEGSHRFISPGKQVTLCNYPWIEDGYFTKIVQWNSQFIFMGWSSFARPWKSDLVVRLRHWEVKASVELPQDLFAAGEEFVARTSPTVLCSCSGAH